MAKAKKKKVTKVQLVDENGITPRTPVFDYVLKAIPLFLVFGAIYQMWALYSIGKMGALTFFSWSQVVNDTVVSLPIIGLVVGSSWSGATSYRLMLGFYKNERRGIIKVVLRTLAVMLIGFVSAFVLSTVEVFAYSEWQWSTLLSAMKLSAMFFAGAFMSTFGYSMILKTNDRPIQAFSIVIVTIFFSGVGLYAVLPIMKNLLASNWCLWKGDQLTTIEYMNDKYFFSSGAILNDSGALIGTGTAVYARNDENKFVGCKPRVDAQSESKK